MIINLEGFLGNIRFFLEQRRMRKSRVEADKRKWHLAIAWWPRKIREGVWVWLELVWQKKTLDSEWIAPKYQEIFAYWEYRRYRDSPFEPGTNGANDET